MSTLIHPTAIVSPKAQIGENVKIGAYTVIEDDVIIGDGTEIFYHVIIANGARIGKNCRIFSCASIATEPQDLKYAGEQTFVQIGDNTVIREFVTVNRATTATYKTVVGSNCLLMAYSHVAHDGLLGNNIILANAVQLAGHVTVEDYVIMGGSAIVHQFSFVGCHAMIGGGVKVVKDIPPFTLVGENPPKVDGINKLGLRRRGFSNETIREIENFYNAVFRSGLNNTDAIAKYKADHQEILPDVLHCIEFIQNSKRGVYR